MPVIWGITPEAAVFRKNMPATPRDAKNPSCSRPPPESFSATSGALTLRASSMMRQIFSPWMVPTEPPSTVTSWA